MKHISFLRVYLLRKSYSDFTSKMVMQSTFIVVPLDWFGNGGQFMCPLSNTENYCMNYLGSGNPNILTCGIMWHNAAITYNNNTHAYRWTLGIFHVSFLVFHRFTHSFLPSTGPPRVSCLFFTLNYLAFVFSYFFDIFFGEELSFLQRETSIHLFLLFFFLHYTNRRTNERSEKNLLIHRHHLKLCHHACHRCI